MIPLIALMLAGCTGNRLNSEANPTVVALSTAAVMAALPI
jgi:hypothetical protein